jgi:hypothetical protein
VNDNQRIESAAAAREARAAAGRPDARGPRGDVVDAALRRYLAAEAYQEHVTEHGTEDEAGTPET